MGNLFSYSDGGGSCDCDSKINRLQQQIDNMNSGGGGGGGSVDLSSLQQQIDDLTNNKQDKGDYIRRGGIRIMDNNAGCRSLLREPGSPKGNGKIVIEHGGPSGHCGGNAGDERSTWYIINT